MIRFACTFQRAFSRAQGSVGFLSYLPKIQLPIHLAKTYKWTFFQRTFFGVYGERGFAQMNDISLFPKIKNFCLFAS